MTLIDPTRRGLLAGLLALGVAPAIVRVSSLMPVRAPRYAYGGVWEHEVPVEYVHEVHLPNFPPYGFSLGDAMNVMMDGQTRTYRVLTSNDTLITIREEKKYSDNPMWGMVSENHIVKHRR